MSFENVPAEVIKRILGSIPDLRHRCRLERMSKTFQACLRDLSGAAWTTGESKLDLGLLLSYNPDFIASFGRVTSLTIRDGFSGAYAYHYSYINALSALYRNNRIFEQLKELCISEQVSTELWNFLLSTFRNSITVLVLKAHNPFAEGQIEPICNLLARCANLRELTIEHGLTIDPYNLQRALEGKNMQKLSLTDCREITQELAQIINSFAKPSTLRELVISGVRDDEHDYRFLRFSLNDFCESLDAADGAKIQRICLDGMYGAFLQALPSLPALFPALRYCELNVYYVHVGMQATEVTQLLSEFLSAGENRETAIHLNLVIVTDDPMLINIWPTLQLLTFNKTLRIKRMREEQTRKFTYGQASLALTVKARDENNPIAEAEEQDEQQVLEENEEEGMEQDHHHQADGGQFEDEEGEENNQHQNQVFNPNYYYEHYNVVVEEVHEQFQD